MRWIPLLLLVGCVSQAPVPTSYPDTPKELEQQLREEAKEMGVRIVYTPKNRSITFRRTIYLSTKWKGDSRGRAKMLAHEVEHSRQYRRNRGFLWKYVFSTKFRYRMEWAAIKEEIRAARAMGAQPPDIDKILKHFQDALGPVYLIPERGE